MPSLWVADDKISGVYVGNTLASAVYRGTQKVWPPGLVREYLHSFPVIESGGPSMGDLDAETGLPKDLTTRGWSDLMYSVGIQRITNGSPRVIAAVNAANYRSYNCYKKVHAGTATFTPSPGYSNVYPFKLYNQWFQIVLGSLPGTTNVGTGIGFALRIHSSNNYGLFFKLLSGKWRIYAGTAGSADSTDANIIAEGTYNSSTWGGVVPAVGDLLIGWVSSHDDGTDTIAFCFVQSGIRYYFHQYEGSAHPQKARIRYSGFANGTWSGPAMTNETAGTIRSIMRGAICTSYRDVEAD